MVASYNGWVASQDPRAIGIVPFVVNGVPFPSGVKGGDVEVIFRYLVEQIIKRVEPLLHPGCWGYYYKNSANSAALLSCHSSGTAIDTSAPKHPNGKRGTFTAAQVAEIRKILAELEGVVYWGGDAWGDGTPDEMHWEIATGVSVAKVKQVADKIRNQQEDDMPYSENELKEIVKDAVWEAPFDDAVNGKRTQAWLMFRDIQGRLGVLTSAVSGLTKLVAEQNGLRLEDVERVVNAAIDRGIDVDVTVKPGA